MMHKNATKFSLPLPIREMCSHSSDNERPCDMCCDGKQRSRTALKRKDKDIGKVLARDVLVFRGDDSSASGGRNCRPSVKTEYCLDKGGGGCKENKRNSGNGTCCGTKMRMWSDSHTMCQHLLRTLCLVILLLHSAESNSQREYCKFAYFKNFFS